MQPKPPVAMKFGLAVGVCLDGINVGDGEFLALHDVDDGIHVVCQGGRVEEVGTVGLAAVIDA